jgi:hypothetical protein
MTDDELDDLFEHAERAAVAYDWNLRTRLLRLYDSSTSVGNEDLENEIAAGELDDRRAAEIAEHLRMNQTRPIDRPNWGKLELAKWMKRIWNL